MFLTSLTQNWLIRFRVNQLRKVDRLGKKVPLNVKVSAICLAILIVVIAYATAVLNARPYLGIAEDWIRQSIAPLSLESSQNLVGYSLWTVLNACEIIPGVIFNQPWFLQMVLAPARIEAQSLKTLDPNDDSAIDILYRQAYLRKLRIVNQLLFISLSAYVVDLVISLWYSPPFVGGFNGFKQLLLTGNLSLINFPGLANALVAVFALSALVGLLLLIWDIAGLNKTK